MEFAPSSDGDSSVLPDLLPSAAIPGVTAAARGHTDEIAVRGITRQSVTSRIRRNQKQTMLARRGHPHLYERKAIPACTLQKYDDCPRRRVCGSELVPTAPERPKTGFMRKRCPGHTMTA